MGEFLIKSWFLQGEKKKPLRHRKGKKEESKISKDKLGGECLGE